MLPSIIITLAAFGLGLVIGIVFRVGPHTPLIATGSLTPVQGEFAASRLADFLDAEIYRIKPTGSMRPWFGETSVVVAERCPFGDLREGDIVIYEQGGEFISHQLIDIESGMLAGINNMRADLAKLTPSNFRARVVGIIYHAPPNGK